MRSMSSERRSTKKQWRTRSLALAAAGAVLIPLLAACGSSDSDDPQPQAAASADQSSGTFPVTVDGAYGEVTIESKPQRVVALSPTDADILIALGITPVAIPTSVQTNATTNNTGLFPWAEGKYPEGTPKLDLSSANASTLEGILALKPDLMVATGLNGLIEQTNAALSDVAPVVAYDTQANGDSWQTSTRKIAKAVGEEAKGEEIIAKAESTVTEAAAQNPGLKGKTFNVLITPSASDVYVLCGTDDNLGRVFQELGMQLSEYARSMPCNGGRTQVSNENLGSLDADVLVAFPDTEAQMKTLADQQLWKSLPAVERGAVVSIPKTDSVPFALAFPSPTSLEWAVDQMTPQLAEAAAK